MTVHGASQRQNPVREWFTPLFALLSPGRYARASLIALVLGVMLGLGAQRLLSLPPWSVTAITVLALLPVGILKWRADGKQHGATVMLLSILLITQGAHTIEHIVQWVQYYLLLMPARQSVGLISAANSEWVHFVWNWGVLFAAVALWRGGMRNWLAVLLMIVVVAHAVEHTYLFTRYQIVLGELREISVTTVTAQGLAGIVGRDGWLARSELTQGTFLCTLPGLTTAMRLDVHFWWNTIEMVLLLGAGAVFLRDRKLKIKD